MKPFHFNNDWFNPTSIARVHKYDRRTADKPYCIIVTYNHQNDEVVYDYKTEAERDNNFTDFVSNWRHAAGE